MTIMKLVRFWYLWYERIHDYDFEIKLFSIFLVTSSLISPSGLMGVRIELFTFLHLLWGPDL